MGSAGSHREKKTCETEEIEMKESKGSKESETKEVVRSCPDDIREVYYCRSCEFEVLQKKNQATLVLDWAFLIVEMLLGIVLFAIELHYDLGVEIFGRYYVNHPNERFVRSMLVRCRLIHAVTSAFPFVFVPTVLLTKVFMRRDSVIAITCLLFGLAGFGCYLACAIVSLATIRLDKTSRLAVSLYGGIAMLICLVYLGHAIFETIRNADYIKRRCNTAWRSCRKVRSE